MTEGVGCCFTWCAWFENRMPYRLPKGQLQFAAQKSTGWLIQLVHIMPSLWASVAYKSCFKVRRLLGHGSGKLVWWAKVSWLVLPSFRKGVA